MCRFFVLLLALGAVVAQNNPPALPYKVDPAWPELPAGWNFMETPGISVDARGHVYVITRADHPVREFDSDGKYIRSFGDGLYERAHAVRVDPEGYIWTVDDGGHTVLKLDTAGRVRMVLGRFKASGDTQTLFDRPTDVAWGPNGDIYVTDGYGNSRVVKFNKEGRFLKAWGKKGKGESEFVIPHSIAIDSQGRVYVADRENYRIQVFDAEGTFLRQWTNVGSPWGLALTPDGYLYMADGYNGRVQKLNLEGQVLGSFGSYGKLPGQFQYVHHLAVGPGEVIYTAEILNWRPQKFVPAR